MALLLVFVAIALVFSFFCSVAEAVLLSVTPTYVRSLEADRPKIANTLRELKVDVDRPLAAILSLNTIAHTIGAAGAGAQAAEVFGSAYLGLASAILTLLILIFSEIIPKTLGAVYWRKLAPITALFLRGLIWLLYPLVILSGFITRAIGQGVDPHKLTREEFSAMADIGAEAGELQESEATILKNLMKLKSVTVTDVMTPRTVVFALPGNTTVADFVAKHTDRPFSRIPLYVPGTEDVAGYVLKTEILLAQAHGRADTELNELKRQLMAVSDRISLAALFELLLERRDHIAIVVDEFGSMRGLVTLEDILETLLGLEIVDERDTTVDMQALARNKWRERAGELGLSGEETQTDAPD